MTEIEEARQKFIMDGETVTFPVLIRPRGAPPHSKPLSYEARFVSIVPGVIRLRGTDKYLHWRDSQIVSGR